MHQAKAATAASTRARIYRMVIAALLCAIGIVIPLFSPLKIVLEPASFTLASHVAIFIAMFISPVVAAVVAVGTTLGFLLGGFPIVIVLRAASHIVFVLAGALVLKKRPAVLDAFLPALLFSFLIGLVHAVSEVLVVSFYYFGNSLTEIFYQKGYFVSVVLLTGLGSVIHSMVDFAIALVVWRPLRRFIPGSTIPGPTE